MFVLPEKLPCLEFSRSFEAIKPLQWIKKSNQNPSGGKIKILIMRNAGGDMGLRVALWGWGELWGWMALWGVAWCEDEGSACVRGWVGERVSDIRRLNICSF